MCLLCPFPYILYLSQTMLYFARYAIFSLVWRLKVLHKRHTRLSNRNGKKIALTPLRTAPSNICLNLPMITFVVRILDNRQWSLSHLWKHNTDRTCAEIFCLFSSFFNLPLGCHRFNSALIWILVNRWDKNVLVATVPINMIEDQNQNNFRCQH